MLDAARENYLANANLPAHLPSLGTRWTHFRTEMAKQIPAFRTPQEAIAYGQLKCGFDHRGPVTEADIPKMKIAQHLLRYTYPRFKDVIALFQDTLSTTPGTALEFDTSYGNRVFASNVLYFHAFYVLTIASFKPDIRSVCEIGGGYGNPAYQWFTNPAHRIERYAIIDIPESLFFAELFLRTALPDTPLRYAAPGHVFSTEPGITLVPLQFADLTSGISFDAVVNTGSMAEMSDEWVAHWADWLGRQNAELFYSFNYFGNPIDRLHEGRATLAPVVPKGWHPAFVRAMPPMMLLHSDERYAAEIIFRRSAEPRDPTLLLSALNGVVLSLDSYILLVYAALHATSFDLELFSRRVIADFGYPPVELLHLLDRFESDAQLRTELRATFSANYPRGAFSV